MITARSVAAKLPACSGAVLLAFNATGCGLRSRGVRTFLLQTSLLFCARCDNNSHESMCSSIEDVDGGYGSSFLLIERHKIEGECCCCCCDTVSPQQLSKMFDIR